MTSFTVRDFGGEGGEGDRGRTRGKDGVLGLPIMYMSEYSNAVAHHTKRVHASKFTRTQMQPKKYSIADKKREYLKHIATQAEGQEDQPI